jgi:hypothetical protein
MMIRWAPGALPVILSTLTLSSQLHKDLRKRKVIHWDRKIVIKEDLQQLRLWNKKIMKKIRKLLSKRDKEKLKKS